MIDIIDFAYRYMFWLTAYLIIASVPDLDVQIDEPMPKPHESRSKEQTTEVTIKEHGHIEVSKGRSRTDTQLRGLNQLQTG